MMTSVEGLRVMVCDDSRVALERLCDTLEDLGCTIVGKARDGESLLAEFSQHHAEVDLVTLDLVLPGMDGLEVLVELKKIKQSVKVIVLSSIVQPAVAADARRLGASEVLAKTFDEDALRSAALAALAPPPPDGGGHP